MKINQILLLFIHSITFCSQRTPKPPEGQQRLHFKGRSEPIVTIVIDDHDTLQFSQNRKQSLFCGGRDLSVKDSEFENRKSNNVTLERLKKRRSTVVNLPNWLEPEVSALSVSTLSTSSLDLPKIDRRKSSVFQVGAEVDLYAGKVEECSESLLKVSVEEQSMYKKQIVQYLTFIKEAIVSVKEQRDMYKATLQEFVDEDGEIAHQIATMQSKLNRFESENMKMEAENRLLQGLVSKKDQLLQAEQKKVQNLEAKKLIVAAACIKQESQNNPIILQQMTKRCQEHARESKNLQLRVNALEARIRVLTKSRAHHSLLPEEKTTKK